MSEDTIHSFNPRLIGAIIILAVVAFAALLALNGLSDSLPREANGRNHAFSRGVTGYAGLIAFAKHKGVDVSILRSSERNRNSTVKRQRQLLVATPHYQTTAKDLRNIIAAATAQQPILIILPKWITEANPYKKGWVGKAVVAPLAKVKALLPRDIFGDVQFSEHIKRTPPDTKCRLVPNRTGQFLLEAPLPSRSHAIVGARLDPILQCGTEGVTLLASLQTTEKSTNVHNIYLLAEPDLLNNFAFRSPDTARTALDLIRTIASDAGAEQIAFDVTLHGFGNNQSLLRFAFVPPFLGLTVSLFLAGLLALWQSAVRFGPVLHSARALPLSKATLIDNSAKLISHANRSLEAAPPYIEMIRASLAHSLHAPAHITGPTLDKWIDERYARQIKHPDSKPDSKDDNRPISEHSHNFSQCVQRFIQARKESEMLASAQALYDVKQSLIHAP